MAHTPETAEKHLETLRELSALEPIFHRVEYGTSRKDFENMMAPEFCEIGASGRRYSREYILETLQKRVENPAPDEWETTDFHCTEIASNHFLLSYTLFQGARVTRRSTLWRRTAEGWKIVFHQGTVVEQA